MHEFCKCGQIAKHKRPPVPRLQPMTRTILDIHRYCAKHGLDPLIPVRISFAGNANGCISCKKAGFRQLGGFNHRQGCGTQVCRSYAPARGNFRGCGRKSQDTVAGLDRILHVQAHIRQVHECAKMGESQDRDMRQSVAAQLHD